MSEEKKEGNGPKESSSASSNRNRRRFPPRRRRSRAGNNRQDQGQKSGVENRDSQRTQGPRPTGSQEGERANQRGAQEPRGERNPTGRKRDRRPARRKGPGAPGESPGDPRKSGEQRSADARRPPSRSRRYRKGPPQEGARPQQQRRSRIPAPPKAPQVPETEPETTDKDYEQMSNDQLTYLKRVELSDEHLLDDLGDHEFTDDEKIMDVVGVKLHPSGPITLFDCKNMSIERGDHVVVETGRGLALGEVLIPGQRKMVSHNDLPRVIRKASHSDRRQLMRNRDKEDAAYRLCKDRIEKLNLPMKLIEVEYLHGGNKAIFYFSADGRVDFRDLVRDLAQRLHTRIEMRQIGVRDVSRMVGGIGVCGCQLCCNLFLREFKPISIRMAKDQDLVLNPQKVSGNCGRLLCCLTYEDALYREAAKGMPKVGRRVVTPDGEGRIRDRDVLKQIVRVQFNDDPILREYKMEDLKQAPKQKPTGDGEPPSEGSPKETSPEQEGVEVPAAEDLSGEP